MTSLKIREFKQTISNYVSASVLPDEVKRMALAEILKEQEDLTVLTLKKEIEARDSAEKEAMQNAESVCEN